MTQPTRLAPALAALLLLAAAPAGATVGDEAGIGDAPVTTTWFARLSPAAQRADRDYVAGMRPHHAGALTMSRDYLADPGRSSPLLQALARAIVINQRYEIGVLDEVARNLDAPPLRLPFGIVLQPVGTEGMADRQRFRKAPVPSPVSDPIAPVSAADVRFAKAMILHHEGALQMARGYHADPAARNGFLGLLNVDIIADQGQEIALMRQVVAAFPGDAAAIAPAPVHGMEGMGQHGHAAGQGMGHQGHAAPDHAAAPAAEPRAESPAAPSATPSTPGRRAAPSRPRPAASGAHAHHHGHGSGDHAQHHGPGPGDHAQQHGQASGDHTQHR